MRKQYTAEERSELIDLVTSTGTTIAAAADRLGVHRTTASNWMRRAPTVALASRTEPTKAQTAGPRFARLLRTGETAPTVEVWIGEAAIRVKPGFDAELLRAVVEALRGGAR